ncbi:mannose-6-phosphate isomerase 1 [Tripterygium wilfordii]|uniref:mannose-6-phosphate isomerase n=1 Tax=Tripterygium wilfordii TaxID=458696 RepID=A0A7J7DNZ7_TRIWF|nr:mannose-6-phosphate isomerase 1-like [Tripterygium wilfordii]KAF5748013.1 mannose-6-phosphate isomerase 1 [Tripterygium wilfordii]
MTKEWVSMEVVNNDDGSSSLKQKKVQRLRCSVQNYDWGKIGEDSQVARLYAWNSGSEIDPDKPYAELWMGTHESGSSYLVPRHGDGEIVSLKSWISKNPNVLGERVLDKWGSDLPFLFKVLSVEEALSIQAHPDKESAKTLHKLLPNVYKDGNHKPEMALAITEFEALCGFISLEELKVVLHNVPEIVKLVGNADANQLLHMNKQDGEKVKNVLRSAFTQLMSADKEMTTKAISKMKIRLHRESQLRQLTDKEQLVLKLEKQYPADIGVISAFFFNYVKLNPGEALYLGANELHAYISGECIECMATSDNVVRAGLTPKHRDIQTLCSMLTYKQGFPEILQGFPLSPYITRYLPPFDEFEVDRCVLHMGASTVFPAIPGPSIFLVVGGEGTMKGVVSKEVVCEGDVLFVPANVEITLTAAAELHLYRAGVNSRFFQTLRVGM